MIDFEHIKKLHKDLPPNSADSLILPSGTEDLIRSMGEDFVKRHTLEARPPQYIGKIPSMGLDVYVDEDLPKDKAFVINSSQFYILQPQPKRDVEKLFALAWKKWGEMQYLMLIEECAELQQAVSKLWRKGDDDTDQIAEEIADVEIMIAQLKHIHPSLISKVSKQKALKLERLEKLLLK